MSILNKRFDTIGVVGLGYVGLPTAIAFAEAGARVIGFDINQSLVHRLNDGCSHIDDISDEKLQSVADRFEATWSAQDLERCDAILICVPTPVDENFVPDFSMVKSAGEFVALNMKPNTLVVLESTVSPGYTRQFLLPQLEAGGNGRVGHDFFLAFSPERIDPGNQTWNLKNTPKVIGGSTAMCCALATILYQMVVDKVHLVPKTDTAEMVKLLENTFRLINIAFVNEFAQQCEALEIDPWHVIDAAATKPFGFMPFYPGPGVGGHCIPVDPHYLKQALQHKCDTHFIDLAAKINHEIPNRIVQQVTHRLNEIRLSVNGSRILVIGAAYKKNISDMRESPSIVLMQQLRRLGAEVQYHDPHVCSVNLDGFSLKSVGLDDVHSYDVVIFMTDHDAVEWQDVVERCRDNIVVDPRGVRHKLLKQQIKEQIAEIVRNNNNIKETT